VAPVQKLTLDGGIRIQKGFGDLAYDLVPLGSAAIVYNFLPDFHLKLNYATGFRAPVYQNTSVPQGGISSAQQEPQDRVFAVVPGRGQRATLAQRPQDP